MQVARIKSSDNNVTFSVVATTNELDKMKTHVLGHFQNSVKVPGFRPGKVPAAVLEKHLDANELQTRFLQEIVEQMYTQAVQELQLRTLEQPKISIKKFVPFSVLEFEAEVSVFGEIKVADYKKIKKSLPVITITDAEVDKVIASLQTRLADKKDVNRASKDNDQIWIDFQGSNSKGQPIKGVTGTNYPLQLGSDTFIPGFESNLVGVKAGDSKSFTLTFPKDYHLKTLAGKKVTFDVRIIKVQSVTLPKLNNAFAAQAGPFKTINELRKDIKSQLSQERQRQARQDFESELIQEITAKSQLKTPKVMVDDQLERMLKDLQQNLTYRGQTLSEFLQSEEKTEQEYKNEVMRPEAEARVKASLVLSEIAESENVTVTPEEVNSRIQALKSQYQDKQMQVELDKPEGRRDITARLITEKTIQLLVNLATH